MQSNNRFCGSPFLNRRCAGNEAKQIDLPHCGVKIPFFNSLLPRYYPDLEIIHCNEIRPHELIIRRNRSS